MFTGLIESIGTVRSTEVREDGRRIVIDAPELMDDLAIGDSIAVDGVCQTVVARDGNGFALDSIATTLSRTTLGALVSGSRVNLERALPLGRRLGGHLVQGHVDATGTVFAIDHAGRHVLLDIDVPDEVADVTVMHGSIAIQGVSLTVNALPADNRVQVALIPHTWEQTTLRHLRVGDRVNLEGDMIGRFVAHLLRRGAN